MVVIVKSLRVKMLMVKFQYDELIATCGLLRPSGFTCCPRSGVNQVATVCGYLQIPYIFNLIAYFPFLIQNYRVYIYR
jgi:hypothetical protein